MAVEQEAGSVQADSRIAAACCLAIAVRNALEEAQTADRSSEAQSLRYLACIEAADSHYIAAEDQEAVHNYYILEADLEADPKTVVAVGTTAGDVIADNLRLDKPCSEVSNQGVAVREREYFQLQARHIPASTLRYTSVPALV